VIHGITNGEKVDKSQAFQIELEDDFKSLEETLPYLHSQRHYGLRVEVSAPYGSTKRRIQCENSDVIITGSGKAVKPEKGKRLGVTEKVNQKERLTLFDASEIRNTYECNDINCRNSTNYCVVDPGDPNGKKLPLLETDISFWAKQRYENRELTIDPVPERILTRLRQKSNNMVAQRRRFEPPAPPPAPAIPNFSFQMPWMSGMPGMGFSITPSVSSTTGVSSGASVNPPSSRLREDD
jgi:hypothetical protein